MKIDIKQSELGNLKQDDNGTWSYYVITKNGKLRGEGFPDPEEAIKHVEREMVRDLLTYIREQASI